MKRHSPTCLLLSVLLSVLVLPAIAQQTGDPYADRVVSFPTGTYWNPTRIVSDNRLAALDTDTTTYIFAAPADGQAAVRVTLLFRRAFYRLMEQKDWNVPDIVMEQQVFNLP
jgi:hypothetical protein